MLDDARKEAFRAFLTAHARISEAADRELVAQGLVPLTWYDVLVTLEYAPGHALRMSELADRVLLSRSGLTRLVDRLVENGLVVRAYCSSDRRGANAVLTEAGLRARADAWPVYSRVIDEHFGAHLSDGDLETVSRFLHRIATEPCPKPTEG